MAVVSEIVVAVGVEGVSSVVSALKQVDGAQANLVKSGTQAGQSLKAGFSAGMDGAINMGNSIRTVMSNIATAVLPATMAIMALKKGFDFAEAGADISALETRFDRLSTSIGTASSTLMLDLRQATKGVKSDVELMQLATDMMGLGFAKTAEEATRLATVAGALDMNMNQLALTLANQTTMRFDQLGVAVDGFDDRLERLKATGMSTNDAFKEAFLQQAEEQILKVGHVADTAAGSFDKLKTAFSNFSNDIKQDVGEGFGKETADMLTFHLDRINSGKMFDKLKNELDEVGVKWGDLGSQWIMNQNKLGFFKDADVAAGILQQMQGRVDAYWQSVGSFEQAPPANFSISSTTPVISAEDMQQMAKVQKELAGVTGLTSNFQSIISYAQDYDSLQEQIAGKQAERGRLLAEGWEPASDKIKTVDEEIKSLEQGFTDMANKMTLDMFQATIAIGGITDAEMGAYLDMAVGFGLISQEGADAAIKAYNDAIGKINGLEIDEKTGNVVVDAAAAFATFDLIEQYAFAEKTVRVMMKLGGSAGPWDQQAIGGPVYPNKTYLWNEPSREGELLVPSQYGRVMSNTEVAMAMRDAMKLPAGGSQAPEQHVHSSTTITINNPQVRNEQDIDKLAREISRRINKG